MWRTFLYRDFNDNFEPGNYFMMAGVLLLLIGLLIILVPEILVAFIASLFFMGGAFLLYWGWQARKLSQKRSYVRINVFD